MKKFAFAIGRVVTAGAFVLALTPSAQAQDKKVTVYGLAIQGPAGPNQGHEAGPNFIVSRTLELGIWPCTVAFCGATIGNTNGFFGKVVVDPESVQRLARNGNWGYHMIAKQTIGAGSVDYTNVPGLGFLGVQNFPTGAIIADGAQYTNCTIVQTLVASGDLVQTGDITTSFAANVFATWTINAGSTCRAPGGNVVKVTGRGSLTFDPDPMSPTYAPLPTYAGTIQFTK